MPKFDYIIQNPPYKGSLHLSFLEEGLNVLSKTGKMIIIEPATWLIKINDVPYLKKYNYYKDKIKNHVKSVIIDRLNHEFNILLWQPISITTIDFNKIYDTIDFICCGQNKKVNSIYDCNLIGNYNIIHNILNKFKNSSYEKLHNRYIIRNKKLLNNLNNNYDNLKFMRYLEIMPWHGYNSKNDHIKTKYGYYYATYINACMHNKNNLLNINNIPVNKHNEYVPVIYGTENELNNWKNFVLNSKIVLFLNICCTIDQRNQVATYLPFFADKKYTDEEIYKLFNLTKKEIELIESTIKNFESKSEWFKRFMEGPNYKKYCKEF